jgi:uncharacterized phage protein (TIGR02218 family)
VKDFSPLAISSAVIGFPARLCVITRTDGTVYRIAESDEPITVSGDTFSPVNGLQISAVKHTNNGEMPSCQINAVHSTTNATFNSADLDIGLFDGATVQLYSVDRNNLTRKGLLFTGAMAQISYDTNNRVVIDVKGPAVGARILMTQKRTPMCRTDLFSPLCQLVASSYDVAATVASVVNAFTFTVSGLAQADGYFNQGVAITDNGVSFIIANWVNSTQTITAYLPCDRYLTVGLGLTLYPGCDKTDGAGGCGKFSNWINFQGENHYSGPAAASQQF